MTQEAPVAMTEEQRKAFREEIEASVRQEFAERITATETEAKQAKEERKRNVCGVEADYEKQDESRAEPCHCPSQAHSDGAADSSEPLPHYDLPLHGDLPLPTPSCRLTPPSPSRASRGSCR